MDLEKGDKLLALHATLEKRFFDCSWTRRNLSTCNMPWRIDLPNVIKGLSRSGEHYAKAVKCLTSRYWSTMSHPPNTCQDDPWGTFTQGGYRKGAALIAQYGTAASSCSESNGLWTIWSFHHLDAWTQTWSQHHVWVAKYSHSSTAVPHYQDLLELINQIFKLKPLRLLWLIRQRCLLPVKHKHASHLQNR